MKNRVTVDVAGQEYTLISEEDPAYVRKIASIVGDEIKAITTEARLSSSHAAILACVKFADRCRKAEDDSSHLRGQVKSCLDEQKKLRQELADARREITRLRPADKR